MATVTKLQPKSERPMVIGFVCLTIICWALALKWLVFGQFIERPTPIAFIFGCVTAFFARYFYRKGQVYAILDSSGDGKAEIEQGKMSGVKVFSCDDLKDVTEIHVYHQIVTSTASYYPCLLFNDGFELWLPEGEHIAELAVEWFKDNFGMELEVITHMNALDKDTRQKEKPGRCHIK